MADLADSPTPNYDDYEMLYQIGAPAPACTPGGGRRKGRKEREREREGQRNSSTHTLGPASGAFALSLSLSLSLSPALCTYPSRCITIASARPLSAAREKGAPPAEGQAREGADLLFFQFLLAPSSSFSLASSGAASCKQRACARARLCLAPSPAPFPRLRSRSGGLAVLAPRIARGSRHPLRVPALTAAFSPAPQATAPPQRSTRPSRAARSARSPSRSVVGPHPVLLEPGLLPPLDPS